MALSATTAKPPARKTTYSEFSEDRKRGTDLHTNDSSGSESEGSKTQTEVTPKTTGKQLLVSDVLARIKPKEFIPASGVAKTLASGSTSSKQLSRKADKGKTTTPASSALNRPSTANPSASHRLSLISGPGRAGTLGTPSISKTKQPSRAIEQSSVKRQLISSAPCKRKGGVSEDLLFSGGFGIQNEKETSEPLLNQSEGENDEELLGQVQVYRELRNTNLLIGKLINEMRSTERRVQALEEERASTSVSSSSSSSGGSGRLRKRKDVPLQVRVNNSDFKFILYYGISFLFSSLKLEKCTRLY